MATWKGVKLIGKVTVIFTGTLFLLAATDGVSGHPSKSKVADVASHYGKYAKPSPVPAGEHPFASRFDAIGQTDSVLFDKEQDEPGDDSITMWFSPITHNKDEEDAPKLEIKPTTVTQPQPSTPQETIKPSSSTVKPTVTVTATSTIFMPSMQRAEMITKTVFVTLLPQDMSGSMDSLFKALSTMTSAIRSLISNVSVNSGQREMLEKVVRLSRPSLIIDNLRAMPSHKRKFLIVHMEKLMDMVTKMSDKRYRHDPKNFKTVVEQLSSQFETLNPLIYRK